jgi:hypothetical protein
MLQRTGVPGISGIPDFTACATPEQCARRLPDERSLFTRIYWRLTCHLNSPAAGAK